MSMYIRTASGVDKISDIYCKNSGGEVDKIWNEPKLKTGFNIVDFNKVFTKGLLDIAFPNPDSNVSSECHGYLSGTTDTSGTVAYVNFPDLALYKSPVDICDGSLFTDIMYPYAYKFGNSDTMKVSIVNSQDTYGIWVTSAESGTKDIAGGMTTFIRDVSRCIHPNDGYYWIPLNRNGGLIWRKDTSPTCRIVNFDSKTCNSGPDIASCEVLGYGVDYANQCSYVYGKNVSTSTGGAIKPIVDGGFIFAYDMSSDQFKIFEAIGDQMQSRAWDTACNFASISADGYLVRRYAISGFVLNKLDPINGPEPVGTIYGNIPIPQTQFIATDVSNNVFQVVANNKIFDYVNNTLLYEPTSTITRCKIYKDAKDGSTYIYYLCDNNTVIVYKS